MGKTIMSNEKHQVPLDSHSYDEQWLRMADFIRFNPGARHRRRLIQKAITSLGMAPRNILDAGCGLGSTVVDMTDLYPDARITGIDFSQYAIEWTKKRFPQHTWHVVNLEQNNQLEKFDLVICTEVIEHLENYTKVITNLIKLLSPHGVLIITTPAGRIHETEKRVGHLRHFDPDELKAVIQNAGGEVLGQSCWGTPGYKALKYVANLKPEFSENEFANGHYGVLKRTSMNILYALTWVTSRTNSVHGVQNVVAVKSAV